MTRWRPPIVCAACGETREHGAYGWCQPCYRRWRYYGRPADGPPPVRRIEHDAVQGTVKGYDLHIRRQTAPCGPCREAHNAAVLSHYHAHGRARQLHQRRTHTTTNTNWSADERAAARTIAGHAANGDDCRHLLQALGLLTYTVERQQRIGGAA